MKSFIVLLVISICFLSVSRINTQLTQTDTNYIRTYILSLQNETNGLFSKSLQTTNKAIAILKAINEPIPNVKGICREIGYELSSTINSDILAINEKLKCKADTTAFEIKTEHFTNLTSLEALYDLTQQTKKLKSEIDFLQVYTFVQSFLTKGKTKLFSSAVNVSTGSLLHTALGLKVLTFLHSNIKDEEVKKTIITLAQEIAVNMSKAEQKLREDTSLFSEDGVSSLYLTSEILEALLDVNSIVSIDDIQDISTSFLNYFNIFKYEYTNIDNIHALVKSFELLSNYPLLSVEGRIFDYIENGGVRIKILNAFGKDLSSRYNASFNVSIEEDEASKEPAKKDDFDLEEEPTTNEKVVHTVSSFNQPEVFLDLKGLIKTSGKFKLKIDASLQYKKRSPFKFNFTTEIISTSKVKLDHLKISVSNTQEKQDEKEITVEHPKRSFKNIKATQNSVIKLKVKLNNSDKQSNRIEQMFLRLRNSEIGKSYSAYVNEFDKKNDYFLINFDLSDSNNIEAYNGIYELTLIVSDVSLDNPMIWNFGKIEVVFKKPLDPNNVAPSYKNVQKPKMETTFTPEESTNKNIMLSTVFSGVMLVLGMCYLVHLKKIGANIRLFPKGNNISTLFSIGFVIVFILAVYVMTLFFVKLNIVQTLIALLAICVPGSFILYHTLKNISIEV